MASINGISVKNLKSFSGHEGETLFQGTLYLSNKKLGFWSQDSWGGPDHFNLDPKFDIKMINDCIKRLNPDKAMSGITYSGKPYMVDYDLELLLYDYTKLAAEENHYKEAVKAGYSGLFIATDGYHQTVWQLPKSYTELTKAQLLNRMSTSIEEATITFLKETDQNKHEIKIYRSAEDFVIGTPISSKDIMINPSLDQVIDSADKGLAKDCRKESPVSHKKDPDRSL